MATYIGNTSYKLLHSYIDSITFMKLIIDLLKKMQIQHSKT